MRCHSLCIVLSLTTACGSQRPLPPSPTENAATEAQAAPLLAPRPPNVDASDRRAYVIERACGAWVPRFCEAREACSCSSMLQVGDASIAATDRSQCIEALMPACRAWFGWRTLDELYPGSAIAGDADLPRIENEIADSVDCQGFDSWLLLNVVVNTGRAGDACPLDASCSDGSDCVDNRCVFLADEGQACSGDEHEYPCHMRDACAHGNVCVDHRCVPRAEACPSEACPWGQFLEWSDESLQRLRVNEAPPSGPVCAARGRSCTRDPDCVSQYTCIGPSTMHCMMPYRNEPGVQRIHRRVPHAIGQPCDDHRQCEEPLACMSDASGISHCAPRLPLDSVCTDDLECVAGLVCRRLFEDAHCEAPICQWNRRLFQM